MTRRRPNAQIVSATGQMLFTRLARNEPDGICKPMGGSALPVACNASGAALSRCRQSLLREEAQKLTSRIEYENKFNPSGR